MGFMKYGQCGWDRTNDVFIPNEVGYQLPHTLLFPFTATDKGYLQMRDQLNDYLPVVC